MEEIKKIEGTRCSKFPNALHLEFHQLIYGYVSAVFDPEKGVELKDGLLSEYGSNIEDEVEVNLEPRASLETVLMHGIDLGRDGILSFIFNGISNAENSPSPDYKAAGAALEIAVARYRGIQSEPADEESAHIDGLLKDLRKPENAAHITTLGLTNDVKALEEKNKEYIQARLARTDSRLANVTEDSKTIRQRVDKCFALICRYIESHYLLAETDEKKKIFSDLIDKMNQTISEFKTTYNMMQGQKKD